MADNLWVLFFSGNMKITIWKLSPISSNNCEGLYLKFILSLLRSWSFDSLASWLNDEVCCVYWGAGFSLLILCCDYSNESSSTVLSQRTFWCLAFYNDIWKFCWTFTSATFNIKRVAWEFEITSFIASWITWSNSLFRQARGRERKRQTTSWAT